MKIRNAIPTLIAVLSLTSAADLHAAKLKVPGHYPTIGDAVDAAMPGDVVIVKEGIYGENLSVLNRDGITIRGKGDVVIDAGGGDRGIYLLFCTDMRLEGLTVRNAAVDGILVASSPRTTIDDCRVADCAGVGVRIHLQGGHELRKTEVEDVAGTGIAINAYDSYIHHNRVIDCGAELASASVTVTGGMNTFESNEIDDNGIGDGFVIGSAGFNTVGNLFLDSSVRGVGGDGFRLTDAESTTLISNDVREVGGDGFDIGMDCPDTMLDQNLVVKTAESGFEIRGDDGDFSRNKVRKAGTYGIYVSNQADGCFFFKNNVKRSTLYGFRVLGANGAYTSNVAKKSEAFDLGDTGVGNAFVDNLFATIE